MTVWVETINVKSYEADSHNRWKPAAFFQAIEEAASHHANSLGFSYYRLLEQKMVWILSRVKIQIESYPKINDNISIQTWSRGVQQKLFFGRDFIFNSQIDQPFAMATTLWVLFNPDTRRIIMPQALKAEYPSHPNQKVFDTPLEKISIPGDLVENHTVTAGYSAVDSMGHVNNAVYIDWICDCFHEELFSGSSIKQLQINYLNEIKPGEFTSLATGLVDHKKGTWVVQGSNSTTQMKAFEAQIELR